MSSKQHPQAEQVRHFQECLTALWNAYNDFLSTDGVKPREQVEFDPQWKAAQAALRLTQAAFFPELDHLAVTHLGTAGGAYGAELLGVLHLPGNHDEKKRFGAIITNRIEGLTLLEKLLPATASEPEPSDFTANPIGGLTPNESLLVFYLRTCADKKSNLVNAMQHFKKSSASSRERKSFVAFLRRAGNKFIDDKTPFRLDYERRTEIISLEENGHK